MTHIWVPKVKILEAELRSAPLGLSGEYTIKKYKVGFKEPIQVVGPFSNLITNWGLDAIGSASINSSYIYVGTSTATPAFTDIQLGAYLGRSDLDTGTPSVYHGGAPNYEYSSTFSKRFNPGAATGNLTEVGFGDDGALTPTPLYKLFSRALIVDGVGSPVAITVLADEYLDVSFTIRAYPVLTDKTDVIDISGTSHTIVSRPVNINAYNVSCDIVGSRWGYTGLGKPSGVVGFTGTAAGTPPALAAVTASNMLTEGAGSAADSIAATYGGAGTYTKNCTFGWGLTVGNLDYGIRGLRSSISDQFIQNYIQATITPAIAKDSTKILSFGYSYSYSRH